MAPPIEPGIQDKNSKSKIELSAAYLDKVLSSVPAPTSKIFFSVLLIYENLELNFITTPLKPPSLIKVLDPAPKQIIL